MKFYFFLFFLLFISNNLIAKEIWKLDKNLSTIEFELPVLFANNVKGFFKEINGLVEIDIENKRNNKAIFSVDLKSIEMNYAKYRTLLLGEIFFNTIEFPIALVDTKKFSYENQKKMNFDVELSIKGINNKVPIEIEIFHLAEELVQIKAKLLFSRTSFKIGTGKWSSTSILKDKASIKTNLFLFKEI